MFITKVILGGEMGRCSPGDPCLVKFNISSRRDKVFVQKAEILGSVTSMRRDGGISPVAK